MKGDMGGGAAVIGAMQAIAALKPKINVSAVCAATENMPGGAAQRPGDVVQAMNGKWIEVENTDAEGRLTLADAITFARRRGASKIVDIATLTGAVSVALGKGNIGAFSNNDDFFANINAAAATTGESVWRLPLDSVSKRQNNSRIADLKNTGGRLAGSITAAHFISEFAGDTPWVHLDIAALNMSDGNSGVMVPGATGVSARLLAQLAVDLGA
jgi:leucyl aminopeptidase